MDRGDTAIFPDGSVGVALFDLAPVNNQPVTLGALKIGGTSTVNLRLVGPLAVTQELRLWGGKLTGPLLQPSRGALTLSTGAQGTWEGGSIGKVDLTIAAGAKLQIWNNGSRSIGNSTLNVKGELWWSDGDVKTSPAMTTVKVESGGVFNVTAPMGKIGYDAGDDPGLFELVNDAGGTVRVNTTGQAALQGNYRTAGTTTLEGGTLAVYGSAEQTAATGVLRLRNWSRFEVGRGLGVLRIRDGRIDGDGVVRGSLSLGSSTPPPPGTNPNPVIAPGLPNNGGTIRVEGNFHLYYGEMHVHIYGPNVPGIPGPPGVGNPPGYDRVEVVPGRGGIGGNASIAGPDGPWRKLFVDSKPLRVFPAVGEKLGFLTYTGNANLNPFSDVQYDNPPGIAWTAGIDPTQYWVARIVPFTASGTRNLGGRVWRDDGLLTGVFEPGAEATLAARTVRLFDAAGATQLASTTTDLDGHYLFSNLDAGNYVVQFDRPSGERFVPQNLGTDDALDSDPDPTTGRLAVALYEDHTDIDAGFRDNAAPIAVGDAYNAHKNTTAAGNVLANDFDADGDRLTAALGWSPAYGSVALNPDGSFVYTPGANFVGTDWFTYTASDGYGGTVTVTVADDPPPVAPPKLYAGPVILMYLEADGVLAGATSPSGGPLTAALVSGPAHGTLVLHPSGAFEYTPDDGFVGTDAFTFRPVDAGGPGEPVVVQLVVTDTPPQAVNDTAATAAGAAVTVAVLTNDTDADARHLLAA